MFQFALNADNVLQLFEEPLVDFGQFVDSVDGVTAFQCVSNDEDTFVGWVLQGIVDIDIGKLFVGYKAVHALADHAEALLDHLFEATTDGHHLTDRFHAGAQLARNPLEFTEVPTRNLADNVVEGRFEAGGCAFGHGIFQFVQTVTKTQLGGNECQRITGRFRSEGRRTAQTGIDLDYPVIFRVGIEGVLYVTLADNTDVADNLDGEFTQFVVFRVGEGL